MAKAGSGQLKRLVIADSQMLNDPSGGRAKWFRVSICGGGGGRDTASTVYSGGGAETRISQFAPSEIVWPVEVVIGSGGQNGTSNPLTHTRGGTTSFGNLLLAEGGASGQCGIGGGGNLSEANFNYFSYSRPYPPLSGNLGIGTRGGQIHANGTLYYSVGMDIINTPTCVIATGTAASRNGSIEGWPGISLLGLLLNKNYGKGAHSGASAGPGVCILEWEE